jgi:nucleotide-binding universal stress UspA family protein
MGDEGTERRKPRIVVGVDGSEGSRGALRWALDEAHLRSATLQVVHVWHHPFEAVAAGTPSAPVFDDPEAWAKQLLDDELVLVAGHAADVRIVRGVVYGAPARVLLDASDGAALVVVGSRGRRRMTGLLLGSVGHLLVARARCPVVVIHGGDGLPTQIAEEVSAFIEPGTLEEMPEAECLALLAGQGVGRLAVVCDGQPLVFPVNYILDGRTVAFRSGSGTKVDWATLGRVAFEVDGFDPTRHEGWSVVVQGWGQDITDGLDEWSKRVRSTPLLPWAAGEKGHWLAIASPIVSGRRLTHPAPATARPDA